MTDPATTAAAERVTETLTRERIARAESDLTRILVDRGTDPAAARDMAAQCRPRFAEFTDDGRPVVQLATGTRATGDTALQRLATEARLTSADGAAAAMHAETLEQKLRDYSL